MGKGKAKVVIFWLCLRVWRERKERVFERKETVSGRNKEPS